MGIHSEISLFFLLIFKAIGVTQFKVVLVMIATMILSIPASVLLNEYFPFVAGRTGGVNLRFSLPQFRKDLRLLP